MAAFTTNSEGTRAMEADALVCLVLSSQTNSSDDQSLSKAMTTEVVSHRTATADEDTSGDGFTARTGTVTHLSYDKGPYTPNNKKSMVTDAAFSSASIDGVVRVPFISADDNNSLQSTNDNKEWQRASLKDTMGDTATASKKNMSVSEHLPKTDCLVMGEAPDSKKKDKNKNKPKRKSVIKIKAIDLGGMPAHQFIASNNGAQAIRQWIADQKKISEQERRRRSLSTSAKEPAKPLTSRIGNKLKSRHGSLNEEVAEKEPHRGRSRSIAHGERSKSRSNSSTTKTESFSSECKLSVSSACTRPCSDNELRRARSVIRMHGEGNSEKRRCKSLVRKDKSEYENERNCCRGRSVAPIQPGKEQTQHGGGSAENFRSKSLARGFDKVRDRCRSVFSSGANE